jgi:hypothetical protein
MAWNTNILYSSRADAKTGETFVYGPLSVRQEDVRTSDDFQKSRLFSWLFWWNFTASMVHLFSFIFIWARYFSTSDERSDFTMDGDVTWGGVCWELEDDVLSFSNVPERVWDRRDMIFCVVEGFFFLSFLFQGINGLMVEEYAKRVMNNGVQYLRFQEYSLSGSLALVGIALTVQINDLQTLFYIFFLSYTCMIFGLVSDNIRSVWRDCKRFEMQLGGGNASFSAIPEQLRWLMWYAHLVGWVPLLAVFTCLLVHFLTTANLGWSCLQSLPLGSGSEVRSVPDFVVVLVVCTFVLYSSFGFVHVWQLRRDEAAQANAGDEYKLREATTGALIEGLFIFLSLTAKLILGFVIASNILFV